jgi:putative endonuclease
MSDSRIRTGSLGEQMAVHHLEQAGMVVLDRNWRPDAPELRGEIDIIARDGFEVVFCEVKTRRSAAAAAALEAITPRKVAQLRRLAAAWLAASGLAVRRARLDAVGVGWPDGHGNPEITHLRGIG